MAENRLKWYRCDQCNAGLACEYCQGITRHEPWCVFVAPIVSYAYQIVADPSNLAMGDALMLHALGVAWDKKQPGGLIPHDSSRGSMNLMLEMALLGMSCRN